MKKNTLLREYALDEGRYKRYCAIIGIDAPSDFPASMMGDFETVVGWFNEHKELKDSEASARYVEFKASSSRAHVSSVSEAVGAALDASRAQIEQEVASIVEETPQFLSDLRTQYRAGVYQIAGQVMLRQAQRMKAQPAYPIFAPEDPVAALPEGKESET